MKKLLPLALLLVLMATLRAAGEEAKPVYEIDSAADVDAAMERIYALRKPPMDIRTLADTWKAILASDTRPPIKVIFDTDIGTDIDDAIALTFALRRPELKICAIVTSRGEVRQRAGIVSRLLQVMGRPDIPYAPGSPERIDRVIMRDKAVDQFPFAGAADDRPAPACADAQELFRRVIDANRGEVWLVVLGPMTNAAILVRDHPDLAAGLKGIVCMGGEPTRATAETNITNDPQAAAIVCRSGLLKFAGTADVSDRMLLPQPDLDRLQRTGTPATVALGQLIALWRPQRGLKPGPIVSDLSPLVWLVAPELISTAPEGWTVDRHGITTVSADAPPCAVSTGMNAVAVHRLLMDTLTR